ncbi:MAG: TonB-dependent receptor [Bacteroidota bacterium]
MQRILYGIAVAMLLVMSANISAFAQRAATLSGTILDAQTGEALPGANLLLVGSGLGATSNIDGKYIVRGLPAGTYTLRVTYVGYRTLNSTLTVKEHADVHRDFKLVAVAIEGETVVVTAQAAGQNEAINQQLSSMPVMNVVSAARIQELPDANAAESVGRLPGVSLVRTGGEGSQVVIRGLSPQFNQITIDGVELPSDVASANNLTSTDKNVQESQANVLGDRADDLSMISSSMLGGIEVIKAITPDMDATLIGGVVNFSLRKAVKSRSGKDATGEETGDSWIPRADFRVQSGFNKLKNTKSDYLAVASVENRFLDNRLGVFIQGSAEQRNLSSNNLGVGYNLTDKSHGDAGIPDLSNLQLTDVYRNRNRVGGTVVMDYQHETGEVGLMNFVSSSTTRAVSRGELINPLSNLMDFTAGDSKTKLNVLSNMLSIKQEIPIFHMDLKLSHSYSESNDPQDLSFNFLQRDIGLSNAGDLRKTPPNILATLVKPNAATAMQDNMTTSESFSRDRTITGSLDLQTGIPLMEGFSTRIKFGGMWQHRTRSYDFNQSSGSQLGEDVMVGALTKAFPWLTLYNGNISFLNFVYDGYSYGNFLNGDYTLPYPINVDLMWKLLPVAKATPQLGARGGYQPNDLGSILNDYNGTENKSAAYAMMTFNIGDQITVLPGVRYQNLTTTYMGYRGVVAPGGFVGKDTTVTEVHGYWLPMVHVRYSPMEWLQLHFAYTNTLNYPDYSVITPRYLIGNGFISYNNFRIKPATSENFDLVAALHSNEIGLLTLDGFKKRIKNLIFFSKEYRTNLSDYPDLPPIGRVLYEFNTYINNPIPIDVYGIETEWQTHFWYLPQPFTGLVLNINYTHIFSQADYPKSVVNTVYNPDGSFTQVITDTTYTTRLLNQPNDIVNLTVGYDYEGFSARVSFLFQDNIFKNPDFWMQNRVNSAKYSRWDLSVRQQLPWFGIQFFFNLNNITGEDELDVNQKTGFPAYEQRYGMSANLGLGIRL